VPTAPGASLPRPRDAAKAFHAWRYYNASAVEQGDVLAIWTAGYAAGGDAMLMRSAAWVGLEPLLADLLEVLVTHRIQREMHDLDRDQKEPTS
jgi:hypothetical protein